MIPCWILGGLVICRGARDNRLDNDVFWGDIVGAINHGGRSGVRISIERRGDFSGGIGRVGCD